MYETCRIDAGKKFIYNFILKKVKWRIPLDVIYTDGRLTLTVSCPYLNTHFSFHCIFQSLYNVVDQYIQGGSNMTGTDLYVNKPHCAAAVRP